MEQSPPENSVAAPTITGLPQATETDEAPSVFSEAYVPLPLAPHCRFGITAPLAYDLQMVIGIGVGNLLDWQQTPGSEVPDGVTYIGVLRVWESGYEETLENLPEILTVNPGGF